MRFPQFPRSRATAHSASAIATRTLAVERLENRNLLSVTPFLTESLSGVAGATTPDSYTFSFDEGDIILINATPAAGGNVFARIEGVSDPTHLEGYGLGAPVNFNLPAASPVQATEEVALFFTVPTAGGYVISFSGLGGDHSYSATLKAFTTLLHDQSANVTQRVFLDFDGAPPHTIDNNPEALPSFSTLLDEFSDQLGLASNLDADDAIDAIVSDLRDRFDGLPIEFVDSREGDLYDPSTSPFTSRVVVSNYNDDVGLSVDGIDYGNFLTTDSITVDLDNFFQPSSDRYINHLLVPTGPTTTGPIANAPPSTIVDAIGRVVGGVVAHEVGHTLGLFHAIGTADIMQFDYPIETSAEVGVDVAFGTSDDSCARLGFPSTSYRVSSSFTIEGTQDSASILRSALGDRQGAPRVTSVKLVDERPGTSLGDFYFDFADRVGSEAQLLRAPIDDVHRVEITFSEQVRDDAALDTALRVVDLQSGELVQVGSVAEYEPTTRTAVWTVTGLNAAGSNAGHYAIVLDADSIRDRAENELDGEWTNPVSLDSPVVSSVFPSGNGDAGGDFVFVFALLPGDTTDLGANGEILSGANVVNAADFSKLSSNFNMTQLTGGFEDADFDNDGDVDASDFSSLSSNFNIDLRTVVIDLNHDGVISSLDLQEPMVDLNCDGIVDQNDEDVLSALLALDVAFEFLG